MKITASNAANQDMLNNKGVLPDSTSAENTLPNLPPRKIGISQTDNALDDELPSAK